MSGACSNQIKMKLCLNQWESCWMLLWLTIGLLLTADRKWSRRWRCKIRADKLIHQLPRSPFDAQMQPSLQSNAIVAIKKSFSIPLKNSDCSVGCRVLKVWSLEEFRVWMSKGPGPEVKVWWIKNTHAQLGTLVHVGQSKMALLVKWNNQYCFYFCTFCTI